ncbi:MAG TPA: inositol monophosphatase family protein [Isosphaeraceae bacterium]|jgi:myo-inositol-1(or 4)-monophosphatase|nr:inositol monophosphatase family protein [Isosphaeraceae bacterium]
MSIPELATAEAAARAGGAVVARYFRDGVAMRSKDVGNLVSDADLEAERAIVDAIRSAHPGHEILAEEAHAGDAGAEHLWVVDPLDGTNNFAHRVPHLAVSIAYYHAGVAQCGVVFNPINGDWHVAERGGGAWYNGTPARVGDESRLDEVLVGLGFYYDRGVMMEATLDALRAFKREMIHGSRRMGTASLDLCMVGRGLYGVYFEYELSPWDFAAGRLFVEEAGGTVTTCLGEPLPMARTSVLASNGRLHQAALEIVKKYHPKA